MWLTISRTFKEAWKNATRNGWLALATISVMVMSLFLVAILYVSTFTVNDILNTVQEKLSVSVYFKFDTTEKTIMDAKEYFKKNVNVSEVEYISRDKALEDFKKNNANDPEIMQSLEEIGENPLWSSLVVRANDSERYEEIVGYIESSAYREDISRINYGKTKETINRLNGIVKTIEKVGIALGVIFSLIAILITFNTIRVTIYAYKKEIEVKRLVGASNSYIRLPFVFEGIIYGLISALISMLILFLILRFLTPFISKMIPTQNLVSFYWSNFLIIFGIQFGLGIILGVFGSLIAMRRYLKI